MPTYTTIGINLKTLPYGESDRLVTVLTVGQGLVQAIAPGARKHKSRLRGKLELFVVNELQIAKGRSLDKILQAETLESYPRLSQNLAKLAVGQYWAEIVLAIALSQQPQEDLYDLLNEHLRRLNRLTGSNQGIVAHLVHGVYHLLILAGLAPQLQQCCLTQNPISPPQTDPKWRIGFSFDRGGLVTLPPVEAITLNAYLNSTETMLLQQLQTLELSSNNISNPDHYLSWLGVERVLRNYTQYQLGKSIQSATLLDAVFINN